MVALFFLRDKTIDGVYAGNIRRNVKLITLRSLHRLGLVMGDNGDVFQEGTFVRITRAGSEAISSSQRPVRGIR